VVMDQTVRQQDPAFQAAIQDMRDGNMSDASVQLYMDRRMNRLSPEERQLFEKEGLYAMPTWKDTVPITRQYLQSLETAVVRVDAKYQYPGRTNHAAKDVNLPVRNALAEKAKVMLLMNYIVELGLFNGSVGVIVKIVYKNREGPRERGAQPAYVVVAFPGSRIPVADAWDPNHPTHVPIPLATVRCDKDCCSMTTVPLRVCKAITIYKSQGMTVGTGQPWEYLVVLLPSPGSQPSRTPGLAQVGFSRAAELDRLAILSTVENPLTVEQLKKIGTGPAYIARREFEAHLRSEQEATQQVAVDWIMAEDPAANKTFDGGYQALVRWFRERADATLQSQEEP